jgi:predicted TIM-barrel fold metal-dependent hydrolase
MTRTLECIDVFCHCLPPRYCEAVREFATVPRVMFERAQQIPVMVQPEARLRLMDEFPGYSQLVSLAGPPVEMLAPDHSVELAGVANVEMARLVEQCHGRIRGFIATLPLDDPNASVAEAGRAKHELGAVGVQIYTSVGGIALDDTRFERLFKTLADLDLPILLHPIRSMKTADYPSEQFSKFDLWWAIGWPYETTLAMVRLALSGLFDRHPEIKIIAHHVGGYLPMLSGRLGPGMELLGTRNPPGTEAYVQTSLQEPPLDACKKFYADTASFGSQAAIACGLDFFGPDRLLFASDMPFDPGQGPDYIHSTLAAIEAMNLDDGQRRQILTGNARRLFKLGV